MAGNIWHYDDAPDSYNEGDVITIGSGKDSEQYELNKDIASLLNRSGVPHSQLSSEHLKTLKRADGKTSTESQIFAGNDKEKAKEVDKALTQNNVANRQGQQVWDETTASKDVKDFDKSKLQNKVNEVVEDYKANPDKPTMTQEEAEQAGKEAMEEKPATIEQAIEQASDEDKSTIQSITSNTDVESVMKQAGAEVEDDPKVVESNLKDILASETGYDDLATAGREALDKGMWDTFAKIGTALSLVMFAVSGGQIPPINFMMLTGTKEKEDALRRIGEKAADTDLITDKRKAIQQDKKVFTENYLKSNPGKTIEDANAEYDKQMREVGQITYGTSAESAKDVKTLENDLKRLDAQTRNALLMTAANSKAKLDELKAAAHEGRVTEALKGEVQKDLMRDIQDIKNRSDVEQYQYFKNSPAYDYYEGDFNQFRRAVMGNMQTTQEAVRGWVDTAGNVVGNVVDGIMPG